jgi:hypothetical protein
MCVDLLTIGEFLIFCVAGVVTDRSPQQSHLRHVMHCHGENLFRYLLYFFFAREFYYYFWLGRGGAVLHVPAFYLLLPLNRIEYHLNQQSCLVPYRIWFPDSVGWNTTMRILYVKIKLVPVPVP